MWKHLNLSVVHARHRKTFKGWRIAPRVITDYELVLVTGGTGDIIISGKKFRARTGDLLFFRPHVLHSLETVPEDCMEIYFIHFLLPSDIDTLPLPSYFHTDSVHQFKSMFRKAIGAHRQNEPLSDWKKNLYLEQIVCELLTELQSKKEPVNIMRIRKILSYIQSDPCREMPLNELADRAGLKKTQFLQSFRQITGTTPHQYILELRLEHAEYLLLETAFSVAEIAEQCGFSDPFYFSRCFKKHFTVSPRQFRETHLINPV